jgi:hypothetical protein
MFLAQCPIKALLHSDCEALTPGKRQIPRAPISMVHFCRATFHTRRWLIVQSNSEELQHRHRHSGVSRQWSALGAGQRCRVVIARSK